jgi:broad specificity phosphatase PhoE
MAVEIIFENHCSSVDNEHNVASGWLNSRLSDKGKQQAKELGERRLIERIDAVFTSDLFRAVETTDIAFGDSGVSIYPDKRLRECNYGLSNGTPAAQIEKERLNHINDPFPDGECYQDVVRHVGDFLDRLLTRWDGKRVVIIGHSATRWALEVLLNNKTLPEIISAPYTWQPGWRYSFK